jgi:hypothetical protein
MLRLTGGEGGMRPLAMLAGKGVCFLHLPCCVEPVLEEAPTTIISLAMDLHRHMLQIVNIIKTDRFVYIDTYR